MKYSSSFKGVGFGLLGKFILGFYFKLLVLGSVLAVFLTIIILVNDTE